MSNLLYLDEYLIEQKKTKRATLATKFNPSKNKNEALCKIEPRLENSRKNTERNVAQAIAQQT